MIRIAHDQELGPTKVFLADHGFNIGDPTQWRLKRELAGGGSLMDIGIYSLQAARYVTGEEPIEIDAMMYSTPGDERFKEVEETINFQLRFPSGVLANCTSSYGYAGQNHYRVVGTKGWAELEPATGYSRPPPAGAPWRRHRGEGPAGPRPLRSRDGPHVRVRDGEQGSPHAGRGGAEGPSPNDGHLRGGEDRQDRQGVAPGSARQLATARTSSSP